MQLTRLVSPSLTDLFIKEIIKNILSGRMSVGQRLPNEREMAKMMKVSRAVINGGVTQLARMGFVEVVPRQGIFVADYKLKGTMETLQAFLEYHGGRFDPIILQSIYEMRDNQESYLVKLVAERRTNQDLVDLRALLQRLEDTDSIESLADGTFEFYLLLAKASGNVLYPMQIYSRKAIYGPMLRVVYQLSPKENRLRRMRQLVDFVAEKNADEAAACVVETNNWSRKIIEAHYEPGQEYVQKGAHFYGTPLVDNAVQESRMSDDAVF